MHFLLLTVAACTFLYYFFTAIEVVLGGFTIQHLNRVSPYMGTTPPIVSIIVAACNEEAGIEPALRSVLLQDYPKSEVIVVNDRSTDRTAEILERIAAADHRLRVITIERLPAGWLGKNNALQSGASEATGELLIFADADIVMEPSVFSRAVEYTLAHRIDHLAVAPRVEMKGFLLNAFVATFALLFSMAIKPWKAKDPASSKHIGIGAFNLVRASTYREIGGHRPIAMRPDDDIKLGKLIKSRGFRQEFVSGASLLSVEWYASFGQMVHGLMKNLFASVDYSVIRTIGASAALIISSVWPFLAIFSMSGAVQIINALTVFVILALFCINSWTVGINPIYCVTYPFTVLVFVYTLCRSMVVTLANNGISWRGTHYSLAELRANRI
jgi:cellulose synthase/poly-beta-1,6-N-acetylglucosamine synthase-like glycosyltransferase